MTDQADVIGYVLLQYEAKQSGGIYGGTRERELASIRRGLARAREARMRGDLPSARWHLAWTMRARRSLLGLHSSKVP